MKINFKEVELLDIEDNVSKADVSQAIGNFLYEQTSDIGFMDFSKTIYYNGEVEVSDSQANTIIQMLTQTQGVKAVLKLALIKLLTWQN